MKASFQVALNANMAMLDSQRHPAKLFLIKNELNIYVSTMFKNRLFFIDISLQKWRIQFCSFVNQAMKLSLYILITEN